MKTKSFYKFTTFRTSYYFPEISSDATFLYKIYTPYSFKARLYWGLFRHIKSFRNLYRVDEPMLKFPYKEVIALLPKGCQVSFNLGTPCDEQKISMLGVDSEGKRFFAKYSVKPKAIQLSKNEIRVLNALHGQKLAPLLLDYKIANDFCFFRTSYVDGENVTSLSLNEKIVDLAINVNKVSLTDCNLKRGLSHGDFTPWNILVKNDQYRLIDWELSEVRILGYDLFTFVTQVCAYFTSHLSFKDAIDDNIQFIDQYFDSFGIKDWIPYLVYYAEYKIKAEIARGYASFAEKYKCLL